MADIGALERVDPRKVEDGVWVPYKADIRFRVAKLDNARHTARRRELQQSDQYRLRLRSPATAEEANRELGVQLVAETILLDWEHVELDGVALPFTVENAMRVLTDFPDVLAFIVAVASDSQTYRLRTDEDGAGNSGRPSVGTTSGSGAGKRAANPATING